MDCCSAALIKHHNMQCFPQNEHTNLRVAGFFTRMLTQNTSYCQLAALYVLPPVLSATCVHTLALYGLLLGI